MNSNSADTKSEKPIPAEQLHNHTHKHTHVDETALNYLLKSDGVARIFHCKKRKIEDDTRNGIGPPVYYVGKQKQVLYPIEALEQHIREHTVSAEEFSKRHCGGDGDCVAGDDE